MYYKKSHILVCLKTYILFKAAAIFNHLKCKLNAIKVDLMIETN